VVVPLRETRLHTDESRQQSSAKRIVEIIRKTEQLTNDLASVSRTVNVTKPEFQVSGGAIFTLALA
jgi:hypothetical protein